MRKSLIALLLLSCAAPALAGPGDRDRGDRSDRQSSARSDDDSDGRRKASNQPSQPSQAEPARPRSDGGRRAVQQDEPRRAPVVSQPRGAPVVSRSVEPRRDTVRSQRQPNSVQTWQERQRPARTNIERRAPVVDGVERRQPAPVARPDARRPSVDLSQRTVANKWRNDWRRNSNYNWRSHRARHSSLFRLGFYYDPFGYSYRRFGYGYQLYPSYYSSRYLLNDPFMYRLPPAWGPYRWVRYWDDALLVDTRNGFVVDVIYDFFW